MNSEQLKGLQKKPFFYSYLITDPQEYGLDLTTFKNNLTKVLQTYNVDILCFRDKTTKDVIPFAKSTLEIAREFGIKKTLINGSKTLAIELGFDGVHFTSQQFDEIPQAKAQNLFTFISCHNEEQVQLAKQNYADGVTFSPIFFKKNKAQPKGCEVLQSIVRKYQNNSFHIIALGGITSEEKIQNVRETKCSGFASITYFTNKL